MSHQNEDPLTRSPPSEPVADKALREAGKADSPYKQLIEDVIAKIDEIEPSPRTAVPDPEGEDEVEQE